MGLHSLPPVKPLSHSFTNFPFPTISSMTHFQNSDMVGQQKSNHGTKTTRQVISNNWPSESNAYLVTHGVFKLVIKEALVHSAFTSLSLWEKHNCRGSHNLFNVLETINFLVYFQDYVLKSLLLIRNTTIIYLLLSKSSWMMQTAFWSAISMQGRDGLSWPDLYFWTRFDRLLYNIILDTQFCAWHIEKSML